MPRSAITHFFKNNYLFRQWTDAGGILHYSLSPATMSTKCEEKYGLDAVERVLDAAHALKEHGVNRYAHRSKPNLAEERQRAEDRRAYEEQTYNDFWRTVPKLRKTMKRRRTRRPMRRRSAANSACPRKTSSILSRNGRRGSPNGSVS